MNMEDSLTGSRFEYFIDELDMTMCCGSDISGKELNHAASASGLYFPLIQDEERSLSDHVKAMEYTSRSARFGPFIDNIVGMNWILPSGKEIKIGERVVKSTTGYDLFRFLLMTKGDFGYACDYVIRLRPGCDASCRGSFAGSKEALRKVYRELSTSSWSHWIDEIDLIISENRQPYIEVAINCQTSEKELFLDFFYGVSLRTESRFEETSGIIAKELPWLTVKCLPSETFGIAEDLVMNAGGTCRVLLINGVILINPGDEVLAKERVDKMEFDITNQGGHIYGNGLVKAKNGKNDSEGRWAANLIRIWEKL